MSLENGTVLGHYEIIASIGAGGMGEVSKARDPRLNRTVAVKIASGIQPPIVVVLNWLSGIKR